MSVARRRALALLVATLASRAAGEEATLASLTGLFQREPERAAALVSAARTRAINQSRHSEGHETYFRQRRRVEAAVGDYRFYVHTGGAFDAITTALFADADRNVLKHCGHAALGPVRPAVPQGLGLVDQRPGPPAPALPRHVHRLHAFSKGGRGAFLCF